MQIQCRKYLFDLINNSGIFLRYFSLLLHCSTVDAEEMFFRMEKSGLCVRDFTVYCLISYYRKSESWYSRQIQIRWDCLQFTSSTSNGIMFQMVLKLWKKSERNNNMLKWRNEKLDFIIDSYRFCWFFFCLTWPHSQTFKRSQQKSPHCNISQFIHLSITEKVKKKTKSKGLWDHQWLDSQTE